LDSANFTSNLRIDRVSPGEATIERLPAADVSSRLKELLDHGDVTTAELSDGRMAVDDSVDRGSDKADGSCCRPLSGSAHS